MIKTLEGIRETVEFEETSNILLYDNTDFEEYPVHWHTPVEILMPLEKDYQIEVNDTPITLREGDIAIIAPGVLHKLYASKGRRIIFQINLRAIQEFKEVESFISILAPFSLITKENHPEIYAGANSLMKYIFKEYFEKNTLKEATIYAAFLQILTLLSRDITSLEEGETSAKSKKIREYNENFLKICDYINKHCTEDLNLDQIAEIAGFSKYHFSRLFKEFTGNSFYQYLNLRRISYAEQLLLDPSLKITDVALASGFNSISSFMRMFKSFKGCTPTKFRELHW